MIRFFSILGLIFILTQKSFSGVFAQTPTPVSVCDECEDRGLISDLSADFGVKNTGSLEDAVAEKLWKDKTTDNVVPVGIKAFDLDIAKTSSENQIKDFLRGYTRAQLLVIAEKINSPGDDGKIKNCYRSCVGFRSEMVGLYEGDKARQFDSDLLKIEMYSYDFLFTVNPDYGDPALSANRNVQIGINNLDGCPVQILTKKNLDAVGNCDNTQIPILTDGVLIKPGKWLYRFKLQDAGKPGILDLNFANGKYHPYCDSTFNKNCPKSFQIIFPPQFKPTLGYSPKS